jgi:hypothetical protein
LGTIENKSHSFQNTEKEEFVLFLVESICGIGSVACIMVGVDNSNSIPNADLIGIAGAMFLFGFIFERGVFSSHIPSILRERIWWVGPSSFIGMILFRSLIMGTLFMITLDEIGLFLLIFIFWVVGAGLKRLLVRGRFEQAYRGMIVKAGERRFHVNRRLLIGTIAIVVIIDLFAFIFDKENFLRILSSSLLFLIIANACLPICSDGTRTHDIKTYDSDEFLLP